MPSLLQLAALLAASACLAGCFIPPCQLGVGIGISNADAKQKAPRTTFEFRAGVDPLQLIENQKDRSFDVGAGVVVDATFDERTMTSLYAEGLGVVHQGPIGEGGIARQLAGAQARLTWDKTRGVIRPGVEPIVKAEVGKFFSASARDDSVNEFAGVHGETAGGVYVGGYFGADIWSITSGLFFRVPAVAAWVVPEH
jgi:hypothetical protein